MVSKLNYERFDTLENVIRYGETGDKFYVILKGVVSAQVPNPSIKDWPFEYRHYKNLLQWKKEEFDPKVEKAKKLHQDSYTREAVKKQLKTKYATELELVKDEKNDSKKITDEFAKKVTMLAK